ncbi:hypothetical protein GCM10023215_58780 [Pseudonocardia yuanmonensis]|uniref:Uncharacterized protein n=1 Tax=Pseudonocardia yuanmonensis TaxID=1095914 RepID=A0ABP8XJK5_9PSEU
MHEARARFEALVAEVGSGNTAQAWVCYHGHQNLSFGVANSVIAEEVARPYLARWPKMDRNAVVQGWAGVYSSFLLSHWPRS